MFTLKKITTKYSKNLFVELFVRVFINDILYVLLPFIVLLIVNYFYLNYPNYHFAGSSKLSFAIVLLFSNIASKYIEIKNEYNKKVVIGGVKIFNILIISSVLLLIFVVFDEEGILKIKEDKAIVFASINMFSVCVAIFFLAALEYTKMRSKKTHILDPELNKIPDIKHSLESYINDLENRVLDLMNFSEKLILDDEDLKKMKSSESIKEVTQQQIDSLMQRLSHSKDNIEKCKEKIIMKFK